MRDIEPGSGNVYADLGLRDAENMLVKARLAVKIGETIKHRGISQEAAARQIGISQPKLSNLLRGQFRGISEAKMIECLTRLGNDVHIVVKSLPDEQESGHIEVVLI